jgi:serine/threonine-protein kinase
VKILSRELAQDHDFVRRFETEAAVLTTLSHPNVVAIIDRGRHEDLLFFAMELMEGKSLRERIIQGPLALEDAALLVGQLLSALHHAHQRGIVHRDLKPENVLLDTEGTVKVADFGLAALMGRTGDDRITHSSVAMGTMSYMAPEQRRDAHGVDQRADLYSAGVVLYELLTGDVPAGRFELPSRRRAGLPKSIDPVIERALAPEPADRFTSAAEMARALSQVAAANTGLRGAFARLLGGGR